MPIDKPPPLHLMAARHAALEAARAELYPRIRQALADAHGNLTRAGVALWPDLAARSAYDRCRRYVSRFKLIEFATSLRIAANGRSMGRGQ